MTDPLEQVLGQPTAVGTLRRALATGRVHHAYRFEGPDGVGKELAAFAFASWLVGGAPFAPPSELTWRRMKSFSTDAPHVPLHPDVVLVERGLYNEVLKHAETASINVEQIRDVVVRRAGLGPHEGGRLVFIVRNADEISPSAASALLKTLEEPGPKVNFLLLTSRPARLLDTIRSRTLAVRFGPLSASVLARLLEQRELDPAVAQVANGSMAEALALADPEAKLAREHFIEQMLAALGAPDLHSGIAPMELKGLERRGIREQLLALAVTFWSEARRATSAGAHAAAERAARRHGQVLAAAARLEANAQTALLVESLVHELRSA